jgi:DNA-binding GntR family transcriptional regulator|tara:strand:+ start:57 stop:725 length:669 start_codon:yes stop_codon:yes gene_type:complete
VIINVGQPPSTVESSATQVAYSTLRDLILTGELAPGEKLKIDSLREVLEMGASPIREALSLLTSDQLVVRQDQRGFRTAGISVENFKEILELRCQLEGIALSQSIQNASEAWIEELVVAHHRMIRAFSGPEKNFETFHKEFHLKVIGNCNSLLLLGFCSQLYDLNIRYRYIAARAFDYEARMIGDEHQRIVDAVVESDFDLANELLCNHYKTTGAFVMSYIK